VRAIFPTDDAGLVLGPTELASRYAYPARPWVRANMVSSVDGAVTVDGRARGLSGDADRRLFGLLRALADVVLVGAGTARVEGYGPALARPEYAALRTAAGQPPAPRIAVVTSSADLDPASTLFADAAPPTLVLTCASAPPERRAELGDVADVRVVGDEHVDLAAAVAALVDTGLSRVLTEGGPHLLGALAEAGLVDELAVSISPVVAGGAAGRIITGPAMSPSPMRLISLLEQDDFLFARYVRTDRVDDLVAPSAGSRT